MRPECRKLLVDTRTAAEKIAAITGPRSLADYISDQQLQWAVERGFEIVGEALSQLAKIDPDQAAQITDYRKIISFRNVLIHGYSHISHEKTWDIVQNNLPVLRKELEALLA